MEKNEKRKTVIYLVIAITAWLIIRCLQFSHGIDWYYSLMETSLTRIGVFFVNVILGAAIWGFGKTIKAKKWLKILICMVGIVNFFGSILGILLSVFQLIFPSIQNIPFFRRPK